MSIIEFFIVLCNLEKESGNSCSTNYEEIRIVRIFYISRTVEDRNSSLKVINILDTKIQRRNSRNYRFHFVLPPVTISYQLVTNRNCTISLPTPHLINLTYCLTRSIKPRVFARCNAPVSFAYICRNVIFTLLRDVSAGT